MGMSADEKLRRAHQDTAPYGGIIIAGITADMLYQYLGTIDRETVDLRIDLTDVLPVNVTIHGTERTECFQLPSHLQRADVTGMPDFVTRLEILQIFFIPIAVCIG